MKRKLEEFIFLFFVVIISGCIVITLFIPPIRLVKPKFVYEYGKEKVSTDIKKYAYVNDIVMKHATLDFSKIKNRVGEYPAKIVYQNKDYDFIVKIEDTIKPSVTLKDVEFFYSPGTIIAAKDLIARVDDASATTAYFIDENQNLEEEIILKETGSYVKRVVVEDAQGNRSASYRVKLTIGNHRKKPEFYGIEEITIKMETAFNPREGVSAYASNGTDLTDRIRIMKNNVNVHVVGTYEVIYYVVDDMNVSKQKSRKVCVVE